MSRTEITKTFNQKQGDDIARSAYLEKTLKTLQQRINTENDKFEEKLKEQRKVYGEEKIALQAELRELEGVVGRLKVERKQLMIPIVDLRIEAEKTLEELNRRIETHKIREEQLEDSTSAIMARIDKTREQEKINDEWELSLKVRQLGIDAESEQVSAGHTKLNSQMKEFMVEVETKTRELRHREEVLEIEKKRAQEYFDNRKDELDKQEISLMDRRGAFEREYNRLKANKK